MTSASMFAAAVAEHARALKHAPSHGSDCSSSDTDEPCSDDLRRDAMEAEREEQKRGASSDDEESDDQKLRVPAEPNDSDDKPLVDVSVGVGGAPAPVIGKFDNNIQCIVDLAKAAQAHFRAHGDPRAAVTHALNSLPQAEPIYRKFCTSTDTRLKRLVEAQDGDASKRFVEFATRASTGVGPFWRRLDGDDGKQTCLLTGKEATHAFTVFENQQRSWSAGDQKVLRGPEGSTCAPPANMTVPLASEAISRALALVQSAAMVDLLFEPLSTAPPAVIGETALAMLQMLSSF